MSDQQQRNEQIPHPFFVWSVYLLFSSSLSKSSPYSPRCKVYIAAWLNHGLQAEFYVNCWAIRINNQGPPNFTQCFQITAHFVRFIFQLLCDANPSLMPFGCAEVLFNVSKRSCIASALALASLFLKKFVMNFMRPPVCLRPTTTTHPPGNRSVAKSNC